MKLTDQIHEINETAAVIESTSEELNENSSPVLILTAILEYWPLIRLALQFAKIFTNSKADEKINAIIKLGDKANGAG